MENYGDLVRIDDLGTQAVLKESPQDTLVMSMKNTSEELKSHIFQNMSAKAADMVRADIDALGIVNEDDVKKAQQKIVEIATRLEEEGKIQIG